MNSDTDDDARLESATDRPPLPNHLSVLGFFIGLALAMVWFSVAESILQVGPFTAWIAAAPVAVVLFLGVPAAFEQAYWRWHDVE